MASSCIGFRDSKDNSMFMDIIQEVGLREDIKGAIIRDYSGIAFDLLGYSVGQISKSGEKVLGALTYGNFIRFCFVFKRNIRYDTGTVTFSLHSPPSSGLSRLVSPRYEGNSSVTTRRLSSVSTWKRCAGHIARMELTTMHMQVGAAGACCQC